MTALLATGCSSSGSRVRVADRVTATLRVNGKPLADADVEVCTSSIVLFRTSPCEGNSSRRAAHTGAGGEVTFEKLPVGDYDIVFEVEGHWTHGQGTRLEVKEGASKDFDALDFTVR